jgi:hypothetical protein
MCVFQSQSLRGITRISFKVQYSTVKIICTTDMKILFMTVCVCVCARARVLILKFCSMTTDDSVVFYKCFSVRQHLEVLVKEIKVRKG